jgi:uncharacterized integral membrane protein
MIFAFILLGLVAVFIIQNTAVVEVKLYVWEIKMSRSLLLLSTLFIGYILGWLGCKLKRKS